MHAKDAALPHGAGHQNLAAVDLSDMLHDGQSQAGSPMFTAAGFIDPVEPFKQPGQIFFRNPNPFIAHPDDDLLSLADGVEPYGAAWLAVVDRVVEQIDDGLLDQWSVDGDPEVGIASRADC